MSTNRVSILMLLAIVVFAAGSGAAQDGSFSDPNVDYSFSLPDAKWRVTARPTATSSKVELVYGDRMDGHLQIRKFSTPKDKPLNEIVKDEEQKLNFQQGFVAGREETFAGKLRGAIFNYEYVAAGRTMDGRIYFLRSADGTVYVLKFSGQKDSMRLIRSQTDSIARTFALKS